MLALACRRRREAAPQRAARTPLPAGIYSPNNNTASRRLYIANYLTNTTANISAVS